MKRILTVIFVLCACATCLQAQWQDISGKSWKAVATSMADDWYGSAQAARIADTLLRYQTEKGGWPKNIKWHADIDAKKMEEISRTGIGATFDNGATITEMCYLARVYDKNGDRRYRDGFVKGLDYIFEAQYDNGGWPQFYPVRPGKSVAYSGHVTYNDRAFVNIMNLLRDVFDSAPQFAPLALDDNVKAKARRAFDLGLDCILKSQIVVDGEPTVWCAQHDSVTLLPAKARAYELPSFSGAESAEIVRLLMSLPDPSPEVVRSVEGAVRWFERHKIADHEFVRPRGKSAGEDAMLVPSAGHDVWARFYDLETGEPFFCDRDGVKRKSLDEIGRERRNGYAWYTDIPAKILKAYPKWLKKNGIGQ